MQERNNTIDFPSVLGAAAHDMKNALCLLLQSLEQLNQAIPTDNPQASQQLANVHYEAARLNTGLVQLLSLYRSKNEPLPLNINECFIDDLIEEVLASNQLYIQQKQIKVDIHIADELAWYLDADLVQLLLNDVLLNAMRYSSANMRLTAGVESDCLVIQLEDDGPGYPAQMLQANQDKIQQADISHGRTGLGLYFARLIAKAHQNQGQLGEITLSNGGHFGGSVFRLKLP